MKMKELFFEKAKENLKAAEILFEAGLYNASANRAYYSAFHIAIAALYSLGITPTNDHSKVQTLFADNFCNRRKLFASKYIDNFGDMWDNKNIADYKSTVKKDVAKKQLTNTKEFFELLSGVI